MKNMNVGRINQDPVKIFDKNFNNFSRQIMRSGAQQNDFVVRKLKFYEKQSKSLGLIDTFNGKLYNLAENLQKSNKFDLAGIIYSYLVKIPGLSQRMKEECLNKAIDIAKSRGDVIHLLARYVDLGKFYKANNKSKKLQLNCLFEQEKLLTRIVNEPQLALDRYNTVSKQASSLDTYKIRLAMTKVDIAKFILRTEPRKAKACLLSAKNIFQQFNRQKEEDFVNTLLSELKV